MAETHRNLLITLLTIMSWLSLPAAATAKSTIGLIIPRGTAESAEIQRTFQETLKAEAPDTEVDFIIQHPYPDTIALGNATRKLVVAGAELIVAYGTTAAIVALNEKTGLPLLFSGVYDPGNAPFAGLELTGCGYKLPLSSLFRYLRELKPISTVCAIYCSLENDTVRQINELTELAKEQRITLIPINLMSTVDLDPTQLDKGDAAIITGGNIVNLRLVEILAITQARQQPSISIQPDTNAVGVTIALYNSPQAQSRRTAKMAAQILAGRPARDIKPETIRNTELVFNLREAKGIGVKIPFQMVAEASKVIK